MIDGSIAIEPRRDVGAPQDPEFTSIAFLGGGDALADIVWTPTAGAPDPLPADFPADVSDLVVPGDGTPVVLDFAADASTVGAVELSLRRADGAGPLWIDGVRVEWADGQPTGVRLSRGDDVWRWAPGGVEPAGRAIATVEGERRLDLDFAPRPVDLLVYARDVRGIGWSAERIDTTLDEAGPSVAILRPQTGDAVVSGRPFSVEVAANDGGEVADATLVVGELGTAERYPVALDMAGRGAVELTVVAEQMGTVVPLRAEAIDTLGNRTETEPIWLTVQRDGVPEIHVEGLTTALQTLDPTELTIEPIALVQGVEASLRIRVHDDSGVSRLVVEQDGETIDDVLLAVPDHTVWVTFTPPVGPDRAPTTLTVRALDDSEPSNASVTRILFEGTRPRAPVVALAAPTVDATVPEGSSRLRVDVVAADDVAVDVVRFEIDGRIVATAKSGAVVLGYEDEDDEAVVAYDVEVREAIATLPPPYDDPARVRLYSRWVPIPPGFLDADDVAELLVSVDVVDVEGLHAYADRRIRVIPDTSPPIVEILRPQFEADIVEGTPLRIEAQAHDDVGVGAVELLAGPTLHDLEIVHASAGLSADEQIETEHALYSPVIAHEHAMPFLEGDGDLDRRPYFVAALATDANGNRGELFVQSIDIVRDRRPALAILAPADGDRAVEATRIPVLIAAEDDVAVTAVELQTQTYDAQGAPIPGGAVVQIEDAPPYAFLVDVPVGVDEIELQAWAVDSAGHRVESQQVFVSVTEDEPPIVAMGYPRPLDTLTQGRAVRARVAAHDDVGIARVELTVEGVVDGPLTMSAWEAPFYFDVPLPLGNAGRTLTFRARAVDSIGQITEAAPVATVVLRDVTPPDVAFRRPADGAAPVEGGQVDIDIVASDDVEVVSVELRIDGTAAALMPASPYRFVWTAPRRDAVDGSVELVAIATDASGNTSSARRVVPIVADMPPRPFSLTAPVHLVAGRVANFATADARDDLAIHHVSLFVAAEGAPDSALVEVGQEVLRPYVFAYQPDADQVGTRLRFTARAVDTAGQETWTDDVVLEVRPDAPPTVEILEPAADSAVFGGQFSQIRVRAHDAEAAVRRVLFLVDGRRVDAAQRPTRIPGQDDIWIGRFRAPSIASGQVIRIGAVAIDAAGQAIHASPVEIALVDDDVVPEVTLISPPAGDVVDANRSGRVSAAIRDNAEVAEVAFTADGVRFAATGDRSANTAGRDEAEVEWVASGTAGDRRTLRARATDLAGNVGLSPPVTVELGLAPYDGIPGPAHGGWIHLAASDAGRVAVVSDRRPQLALFDVDPTIEMRSSVELSQVPRAVAFVDADRVAVLYDRTAVPASPPVPARVEIYDFVELSTPRLTGAIDLPGIEAMAAVVAGRLLWIAQGADGVTAVDPGGRSTVTGVTWAPARLATFPVDGEALDLAIDGTRLAIAAGAGGLRFRDLRDPSLGEVPDTFVPLPGEARHVAVRNRRAYVGLSGLDADVAVVDLDAIGGPSLVSLEGQVIRRADVQTDGVADVAARGNSTLAVFPLFDQDGRDVKGVFSWSTHGREVGARTRARGNLPRVGELTFVGSTPAVLRRGGVALYQHDTLRVVAVEPVEGATGIPTDGAFAARIELSADIDPLSLEPENGPTRVRIRRGDPHIGPVVTGISAHVGVRAVELTLEADTRLEPGALNFIVVDPELADDQGHALGHRFVSAFTTRAGDAAPPTLDAVEPAGGSIAGGTRVTVLGTGFHPGASVLFGDAPATNVRVADDGQTLAATTPAGPVGPAALEVQNPDGERAVLVGAWLYAEQLGVDAVHPSTGGIDGGQRVEIAGTGFVRGVQVFFGDELASDVRVLSPGHLAVTTPAHPYGPVDVAVAYLDGRRAVAPAAYHYTRFGAPGVIGRFIPRSSGDDVRPAHLLPRGTPDALDFERHPDGRQIVWLLTRSLFELARPDIESLLEHSVLGAMSAVEIAADGSAGLLGGINLPPPFDPVDIVVVGETAYVVAIGEPIMSLDLAGEGTSALFAIDVSMPEAPRITSWAPMLGDARAIDHADGLLLVAGGDAGLGLYTMRDPKRPILVETVAQFRIDGEPHNWPVTSVVVRGTTAYVELEASSVARRTVAIDLSRTGRPVTTAWPSGIVEASFSERLGVARHNRQIVVADGEPAEPADEACEPLIRVGSIDATSAGLAVSAAIADAHVHICDHGATSRPAALDVVSMWPASQLADVALLDGRIAVSVASNEGVDDQAANDALAILQMPFPTLVELTPRDGARDVPVIENLQLRFDRPIATDALTVDARRVDGSAAGEPVPVVAQTIVGHPEYIQIRPADPSGQWASGAELRFTLRDIADPAGNRRPGELALAFATRAPGSVATPLEITGVTPDVAPIAENFEVRVDGAGFDDRTEVRIGQAWLEVTAVAADGSWLTVIAEPQPSGVAPVVVAHPERGGAVRLDGVLFRAPVEIGAVEPARGTVTGGTRVEIRGAGFLPGARVFFGDRQAHRVRVISLNVVEAYTPDGELGPVDVRVEIGDDAGRLDTDQLDGGFVYDAPTLGAIALLDDVRDIVAVGDLVFVAAGAAGLVIVDISGVYTHGPFAGLYIPPDRRRELVDHDRDHVDDRIVGTLDVGGVALAISYPPDGDGGDRLFVGVGGDRAALVEVDVGDPTSPAQRARTDAGPDAAFDLDAEGDRVWVAAGTGGLRGFDISHGLFWSAWIDDGTSWQSLAVIDDVLVTASGGRDAEFHVTPGELSLRSAARPNARLGGLGDGTGAPLSIAAQRIREWRHHAVIAAGADGLLRIDLASVNGAVVPQEPVVGFDLGIRDRLPADDLGGPALDVAVIGDLAYVAVGGRGIAVVELSDDDVPRVLHHVVGEGTTVETLAVAGGRVVSGWGGEDGDATFEYGAIAPLVATHISVADGAIVPRDLPSLTVAFSTTIAPETAADAFSLVRTDNCLPECAPIPGRIEAGVEGALRSTITFRPAQRLPAGAALRLQVSTKLESVGRSLLLAPLTVRFSVASGDAAAEPPRIRSIAPRTGLASTEGQSVTLTGEGLSDVEVWLGGELAVVESATLGEDGEHVVTVTVPSAPAGPADVRVADRTTGLIDLRRGGYLYIDPVRIYDAAPRFFDPNGHSQIRLEGRGFSPGWAAGASGTIVEFNGVAALSVDVESAFAVTADVPPGLFGPAVVTASVQPAGLDEPTTATSPIAHAYGLPFSGEGFAAGARPVALAPATGQPSLIHVAAGHTASGNLFTRSLEGVVASGGRVPASYRVFTYDVEHRGAPRAAQSAEAATDTDGYARLRELIDRYGRENENDDADSRSERKERDALLASLERAPDAADIATHGDLLLVANGKSGLVVVQPDDVVGAGVGVENADDFVSRTDIGTMVTRVLPTERGALVSGGDIAGLAPCPDPLPPVSEGEHKSTFAGSVNGGRLDWFDLRDPTDPIRLRSVEVDGPSRFPEATIQPFPVALARTQTHVLLVEAPRRATKYCPSIESVLLPDGSRTFRPSTPPEPEYSLGMVDVSANGLELRESRLSIYPRNLDGPPSIFQSDTTITDVAVVDDVVVVVAVADVGLQFFALDALLAAAAPVVAPNGWPPVLDTLRFDARLSQVPGRAVRLRAVGDLLFVAADTGGVVIIDVRDPRAPSIVSAGNLEAAHDVLVMGKRLFVAGGDRLTELELPFLFVTGSSPADGETVAPDLDRIAIWINAPVRQTALAGSIGLDRIDVDPIETVPVSWVGDLETGEVSAVLSPGDLVAGGRYRLSVDGLVEHGGDDAQLIPYEAEFALAPTGSTRPRIASITPDVVWADGLDPSTRVTVFGTGFAADARVDVGGIEVVAPEIAPDGLSLSFDARDLAEPGPATVTVTNPTGVVPPAGPDGLSARLEDALFFADGVEPDGFLLEPAHGPVRGGTRVEIAAIDGRSPFAPGVAIHVGGRPAVDTDIINLRSIEFTTPEPESREPGFVPVTVERPDGSVVEIGRFSYDLPRDVRANLPGFPPRGISDLALAGDTLFVGVPTTGYEGLEIIDVFRPERPIRLGGIETRAPVRGVAVPGGGQIALLAADTDGLVVIDTAELERPYRVTQVEYGPMSHASSVRLRGEHAYVGVADDTAASGGLRLHELRSGRFTMGSTIDAGFDVFAHALDDTRLATVSGQLVGDDVQDLAVRVDAFADGSPHTLVDQPPVFLKLPETQASSETAFAAGVAFVGQLVYVTWRDTLLVYEIHDASPNDVVPPVMARSMGAPASGIAVAGVHVLVATASDANAVVTIPPTRLQVLEIDPPVGDISPTTAFDLRISLPIRTRADATDVTDTAIAALVDAGQLAVTQASDGAAIAGEWTVRYHIVGSTLTFTPADELPVGETLHLDVAGLESFDLEAQDAPFHAAFDVIAEAPAQAVAIEHIVPRAAHLAAGETIAVTLRGHGLAEHQSVTFGELVAAVRPAPAGTPYDGSFLEVDLTAPAEGVTEGPVSVVITDGPASASLVGGFIFLAELALTSVAPDRGPQRGGTSAVIEGHGLTTDAQFTFDDTPAYGVRVVSTTEAYVTVPTGSPGPADVTVTRTTDMGDIGNTLPGAYIYGAGAASHAEHEGPVNDLLIDGAQIWIATGGQYSGGAVSLAAPSRVAVIDVSEPHAPVTRGIANLSGAVRLARVDGDVVVATDDGLVAFDAARTDALVERWRVGTGARVSDVARSGALLAAACPHGVDIYRLGEADAPLLVHQAAVDGPATAVAFHGPWLLIGVGGEAPTIRVHDARRGDLPLVDTLAIESTFGFLGAALDIVVDGERAIAALGDAGHIAVVGLGADGHVVAARAIALTDPMGSGDVVARRIVMQGDVAYVAADGGEIQRWWLPRTGALASDDRHLDDLVVEGGTRTLALRGRFGFIGTRELLVGGHDRVELPVDPFPSSSVLSGRLHVVDLERQRVARTWPVDGDIVPVDAPIGLELSHALDAERAAAAIALEFEAAPDLWSAVAVSTAISPARGGVRVDVTPIDGLVADHLYRLTLTAGIAPFDGLPSDAEAVVNFRTGADATEQAPELDAAYPGTGLAAGGDDVRVEGEKLRAGTTFHVGGTASAAPADGAFSADGVTATFAAPPAPVSGVAAIEACTSGGLCDLRLGAWRYVDAPSIDAVEPSRAPVDSRARIDITGHDFFDGVQVHFGGRPARRVTVTSSGRLLVDIPDGVVGDVPVELVVPRPDGPALRISAAGPFVFTLPSSASLSVAGRVTARVGTTLLAAAPGQLTTLDLSRPDVPIVGMVDTPPALEPIAIVVHEHEIDVVGHDAVARFDRPCPDRLSDECMPTPSMDATWSPMSAAGFSAASHLPGSDTLIVADGGTLWLVRAAGGELAIVDSIALTDGDIVALATAGDTVVAGVTGDVFDLTMLAPADGPSPLVRAFDATTLGDVEHLAVHGAHVAVGHTLGVDVYDTGAPQAGPLASWPGAAQRVSLHGPWLAVLAPDDSVSLVDVTTAEATRRTDADPDGLVDGLELVAGALLTVGPASSTRFDLPFPAPVVFEPEPGGRTTGAAGLRVTIADRLDQMTRIVDGTSIDWTPAPPEGTTTSSFGQLVRSTASSAQAGVAIVDIHFGSTGYLGGTLTGPWRMRMHVDDAATPPFDVSGLSPDHGAVGTGIDVAVDGIGLASVESVLVGGLSAEILSQNDDSLVFRISAADEHAPGAVAVVLGRASEPPFELRLPAAFVFRSELVLADFAAFSPTQVDGIDGGEVRVTGTGFGPDVCVRVVDAGASADAVPCALTRDHTPDGFAFDVPPRPDFPPDGSQWLDVVIERPAVEPLRALDAVERIDATPPTLVSSSLTGGIQGVAHDIGALTFEFSEPIEWDAATMHASMTCSDTPIAVNVSRAESTLSLSIAGELPSNRQCFVSVDAVEDVAGNRKVNPVGMSFGVEDFVAPSVTRLVLDGFEIWPNAPPAGPFPPVATHRLEIEATDVDGGEIDVETIEIEGGVILTPQPQLTRAIDITWPSAPEDGAATIRVRVIDGGGNPSADAATEVAVANAAITVTDIAPPVISHLGDTVILTGTGYSVDTAAEARDLDDPGSEFAFVSSTFVSAVELYADVPPGAAGSMVALRLTRPGADAVVSPITVIRVDMTPPHVIVAEVTPPLAAPMPEDTELRIPFDEPLSDPGTATVTCAGQDLPPSEGPAIVEGHVVRIALSALPSAAACTVHLADALDAATAPNTMDPTTLSFDVVDHDPPIVRELRVGSAIAAPLSAADPYAERHPDAPDIEIELTHTVTFVAEDPDRPGATDVDVTLEIANIGSVAEDELPVITPPGPEGTWTVQWPKLTAERLAVVSLTATDPSGNTADAPFDFQVALIPHALTIVGQSTHIVGLSATSITVTGIGLEGLLRARVGTGTGDAFTGAEVAISGEDPGARTIDIPAGVPGPATIRIERLEGPNGTVDSIAEVGFVRNDFERPTVAYAEWDDAGSTYRLNPRSTTFRVPGGADFRVAFHEPVIAAPGLTTIAVCSTGEVIAYDVVGLGQLEAVQLDSNGDVIGDDFAGEIGELEIVRLARTSAVSMPACARCELVLWGVADTAGDVMLPVRWSLDATDGLTCADAIAGDADGDGFIDVEELEGGEFDPSMTPVDLRQRSPQYIHSLPVVIYNASHPDSAGAWRDSAIGVAAGARAIVFNRALRLNPGGEPPAAAEGGAAFSIENTFEEPIP